MGIRFFTSFCWTPGRTSRVFLKKDFSINLEYVIRIFWNCWKSQVKLKGSSLTRYTTWNFSLKHLLKWISSEFHLCQSSAHVYFQSNGTGSNTATGLCKHGSVKRVLEPWCWWWWCLPILERTMPVTGPIALHGYKCVSHSHLRALCQVENILLCTTGKSSRRKQFTRIKEVNNKVVQESNTDLKSEMIIQKQGLT